MTPFTLHVSAHRGNDRPNPLPPRLRSRQALTAYGFIDDRNGQRGDGRNNGGEASVGSGGRREQTLEAKRSEELLWSFLGGSFAGLCQAVVTIPTDNVKVKLQASS